MSIPPKLFFSIMPIGWIPPRIQHLVRKSWDRNGRRGIVARANDVTNFRRDSLCIVGRHCWRAGNLFCFFILSVLHPFIDFPIIIKKVEQPEKKTSKVKKKSEAKGKPLHGHTMFHVSIPQFIFSVYLVWIIMFWNAFWYSWAMFRKTSYYTLAQFQSI